MSSLGQRPVLVATLLTLAWVVASVVVVVGVRALVPGVETQVAALVALVLLAVGVAALVTRLGWWREIGCNPPSEWRQLRLLLLPLALVLLPLAGGVDTRGLGSLPFLIAGYALTGFAEEALSRGLVMRVLRPTGVARMVLISALLFGLMHLANIIVRGNVAITVAQAVGAASFGVGYGALRWRTNTLWPLMALHGLHDLVLQVMALPLIPVDVVQDVVLLVFGLWLIRHHLRRGADVAAPTGNAATATS